MSGELQPLEIILQVQIKEWQIVIHLIFVVVTVHFADAECAVVDALLVWDNDGQGLNFQGNHLKSL